MVPRKPVTATIHGIASSTMLDDILLTALLTLCLPMLAAGSDGSELLSDLKTTFQAHIANLPLPEGPRDSLVFSLTTIPQSYRLAMLACALTES
jgi:hypothetical protein